MIDVVVVVVDEVMIVAPCGVVAVITISVVLVVYIEIDGTMCNDSCCCGGLGGERGDSTGFAGVTTGVLPPVGPK